MSFISDFFDGLTDNLVPALIVGAAAFFGPAGAFAWGQFTTVVPAIGRMTVVGGGDDDSERDDNQ